MKIKTTRKALESQPNVYNAGYKKLHALLANQEPIAYTGSKEYGWLGDVYQVNNIIIHTGYTNLAGKKIPSELCQKYENLAREALVNNDRKKIDSLLNEFCKDVQNQTKTIDQIKQQAKSRSQIQNKTMGMKQHKEKVSNKKGLSK